MTYDLAAALIADVPRINGDRHFLVSDVLAALTAALDGVTERAWEVLEGVTPGPWTLSRLADRTPHSIQASYGCVNGLSALFTLAHINVPDEAEVGMTDGAFDRETAEANARFIAWARNNVPALLAQNAALRAQIKGQSEMMAAWRDDLTEMALDAKEQRARAEAAEAVAEKLRGALERIADTDPDDGTDWFHAVARAALTTEADNE